MGVTTDEEESPGRVMDFLLGGRTSSVLNRNRVVTARGAPYLLEHFRLLTQYKRPFLRFLLEEAENVSPHRLCPFLLSCLVIKCTGFIMLHIHCVLSKISLLGNFWSS